MTTLISLIGKSKADPQTGYRKAHYSFEPNFSRTVSFFGLALLDYAKPKRLILAGTAGSMWDVFFEHQQTDDEAALALADRYLARQDYLRTITYLCEAYISRATEKFGRNVNLFEDRERAFQEADKNQDVWLLKHLRNAITHGVLSDNHDANPLLQDQQKLDKKLRALRKSLFQ